MLISTPSLPLRSLFQSAFNRRIAKRVFSGRLLCSQSLLPARLSQRHTCDNGASIRAGPAPSCPSIDECAPQQITRLKSELTSKIRPSLRTNATCEGAVRGVTGYVIVQMAEHSAAANRL